MRTRTREPAQGNTLACCQFARIRRCNNALAAVRRLLLAWVLMSTVSFLLGQRSGVCSGFTHAKVCRGLLFGFLYRRRAFAQAVIPIDRKSTRLNSSH